MALVADIALGPSVERLVLGRSVAEALALLPRVFNLCRMAQGTGLRLALGLPVANEDHAALGAEIRRDHALYLGVILPRALGIAPVSPQALLGHDLPALDRPADLDRILTDFCPIGQIFCGIRDRFPDGAAATGLLPWPDPANALTLIPLENTVAARHACHPVLDHVAARHGRGPLWRVLARFVDLSSSRLPEPVSPRQGVALVPATRGLYAIEADAADGRLTRFARVTPTDHLTAPGGVLAQSLATCPKGAEDLLLAVLDPCLPVTLREAADA